MFVLFFAIFYFFFTISARRIIKTQNIHRSDYCEEIIIPSEQCTTPENYYYRQNIDRLQ